MQRSSPTPATKLSSRGRNMHTQITWVCKQTITILQALKPWNILLRMKDPGTETTSQLKSLGSRHFWPSFAMYD